MNRALPPKLYPGFDVTSLVNDVNLALTTLTFGMSTLLASGSNVNVI